MSKNVLSETVYFAVYFEKLHANIEIENFNLMVMRLGDSKANTYIPFYLVV